MKNKSINQQRRPALKKIGLGSVFAGTLVMTSGRWLKPVVETVVLPTHADTTSPIDILPQCYSVSVRVFDLSNTPPSGGNASFKIELTSDAPDVESQVTVTASVDNGSLVGTTNGVVYTGSSLIFAWTGPGVIGIPVPNAPTQLSVDWVCANSQSGTSTFDLVDLVLTASAATSVPPAP